ncbi:DUF6879 family protein [Nocardia nova]|uniref:DUF6879 family protein n=1 Tax=Nocardia nova TaxID=37330 RepID=UPI00379D8B4F
MQLLPVEAFPELFGRAERSAFHLETRDAYDVADENPPLARYLAGHRDDDYAWFQPWLDLIRDTTNRGVAVSRVRVVTVPLTDYQRWLLAVTAQNQQAGEDIRYLPRHEAGAVPADDWWLYDDSMVAFNLVDPSGRGVGTAATTDPEIVAHCRSVKERLWTLATPFTEFAESASLR